MPYVAKLGLDHIHHYDSDSQRDWDGLKHGFLILRTQILLSGTNLYLEPLLNFRPHQRSVQNARSACSRRRSPQQRRAFQ
jgi:hypothetical protein